MRGALVRRHRLERRDRRTPRRPERPRLPLGRADGPFLEPRQRLGGAAGVGDGVAHRFERAAVFYPLRDGLDVLVGDPWLLRRHHIVGIGV
jgi:hypothetical protein